MSDTCLAPPPGEEGGCGREVASDGDRTPTYASRQAAAEDACADQEAPAQARAESPQRRARRARARLGRHLPRAACSGSGSRVGPFPTRSPRRSGGPPTWRLSVLLPLGALMVARSSLVAVEPVQARAGRHRRRAHARPRLLARRLGRRPARERPGPRRRHDRRDDPRRDARPSSASSSSPGPLWARSCGARDTRCAPRRRASVGERTAGPLAGPTSPNPPTSRRPSSSSPSTSRPSTPSTTTRTSSPLRRAEFAPPEPTRRREDTQTTLFEPEQEPRPEYRLPDPGLLHRSAPGSGPNAEASRARRRSAPPLPVELRGRGDRRRPDLRPARHPLRAPARPRHEGGQGRPAPRRPLLRARHHRDPHPRPDPRQAGGRRGGAEPLAEPRHPRRHLRRDPAAVEPALGLARQGDRRHPRLLRPRPDAAPADRRHDGLGQVGLHQRDPHLDPAPLEPGPGAG